MAVKTQVLLELLNVNVATVGPHIFAVGPVASGTKFLPYELLSYGVTNLVQGDPEDGGFTVGEAAAYTNLGTYSFFGNAGLRQVALFTGRNWNQGTAYDSPEYDDPRATIITMPSPIGVKIKTAGISSGTAHFFLLGWFIG